jgi:hypothetical protein
MGLPSFLRRLLRRPAALRNAYEAPEKYNAAFQRSVAFLRKAYFDGGLRCLSVRARPEKSLGFWLG